MLVSPREKAEVLPTVYLRGQFRPPNEETINKKLTSAGMRYMFYINLFWLESSVNYLDREPVTFLGLRLKS